MAAACCAGRGPAAGRVWCCAVCVSSVCLMQSVSWCCLVLLVLMTDSRDSREQLIKDEGQEEAAEWVNWAAAVCVCVCRFCLCVCLFCMNASWPDSDTVLLFGWICGSRAEASHSKLKNVQILTVSLPWQRSDLKKENTHLAFFRLWFHPTQAWVDTKMTPRPTE